MISEDAVDAMRRTQAAGDLLHLYQGNLFITGVTHVVAGKKDQVRTAECQLLDDPLMSPTRTLDMQVGQVSDAQPIERGGQIRESQIEMFNESRNGGLLACLKDSETMDLTVEYPLADQIPLSASTKYPKFMQGTMFTHPRQILAQYHGRR